MMKYHRSGFTVVEMLVVLVVLGIVLSMTLAAYSNWRVKTAETEVKNDLKSATTALKNYRNFNNTYPSASDFSTVFKSSENVSITDMGEVSAGSGHCLVGQSLVVNSVKFVVTTDKTTSPVAGNSCSGL